MHLQQESCLGALTGARSRHWVRDPALGLVQLLCDRLRWCCREFLPLVALAPLRLLANAWRTSRRMQGELGRCRFGWMVVGGDDVQRYAHCPRALQIIRGPRHVVPVRLLGDNKPVGLGVLPTSAAHVFESCAWLYVLCRCCCECGQHETPPTASGFGGLPHALRRLAFVRAPVLRRHLLRSPVSGAALPGTRRCRRRMCLFQAQPRIGL